MLRIVRRRLRRQSVFHCHCVSSNWLVNPVRLLERLRGASTRLSLDLAPFAAPSSNGGPSGAFPSRGVVLQWRAVGEPESSRKIETSARGDDGTTDSRLHRARAEAKPASIVEDVSDPEASSVSTTLMLVLIVLLLLRL